MGLNIIRHPLITNLDAAHVSTWVMASLYTEPSVQPVAQLLVRAGAHCDICIIRSASVYDKQRSERERGGSKDAPEMTLYVEIKAAHIV